MKWGPVGARSLAHLLALTLCASAAVAGPPVCPSERTEPVVMIDPALCAKLDPIVRKPSALPFDQYERLLNQYAANFCHRNEAAGWVRDKRMRPTGPRIATFRDGNWTPTNFATHSPVVIWYSREMAEWIRTNRPAGGPEREDGPPPPDGAIMVKEQYPNPAAPCRDVDPLWLFPANGGSIMVRDSGASYDGWFWGYFDPNGGFKPTWPPGPENAVADMGFALPCINCHASARFQTFAASENMEGEPGRPLVFLSQDFANPDVVPLLHNAAAPAEPPSNVLEPPRPDPDEAVIAALRAYRDGDARPRDGRNNGVGDLRPYLGR